MKDYICNSNLYRCKKGINVLLVLVMSGIKCVGSQLRACSEQQHNVRHKDDRGINVLLCIQCPHFVSPYFESGTPNPEDKHLKLITIIQVNFSDKNEFDLRPGYWIKTLGKPSLKTSTVNLDVNLTLIDILFTIDISETQYRTKVILLIMILPGMI